MKKNIFLVLFLIFSTSIAYSQKSKLASQYFRLGEYEKAAVLYKSLYEKEGHNNLYFTYYFKSLINAEMYEDAIKAINKFLKRRPGEIQFIAWKGYLYEKLDNPKKAEKLYKKAVKSAKVENYQIIKLANVFKELSKYDWALAAYEKGLENKKHRTEYLYYLANLYGLKGENTKMADYYLEYIEKKEDLKNLNLIESSLASNLNDKELDSFRLKLIKSIQNHPDNINLIELLSWVYLKSGNYRKAMRQIIAIDRRLNQQGQKVFKFAQDAKKAGEKKIAAKSYQYIIENKGYQSPYYFSAIRNYLSTTKDILNNDTTTTESDFIDIEKQYEKFISQFGISDRTFNLILELSNLEVYNLHNIDKGIKLLKDLIKRRNLKKQNIAKAKILLGDFYIIKGEIWESSLFYSQVDKDFKEGELGELARFKNGQLYYYAGDFEWAQTIFDILKPATTRKISNDAIELSVFISETTGEDSTMVEPLKMYSEAELLITQNKYKESISKLDSINFLYPKNNLEDDIWYLKAHIFKKQKKYDMAIDMYNRVLKNYPEELRADNSLFELAELYENQLGDIQKATKLYEKLFLEYPSSTLAIEARKKYRKLNEEVVQ